MLLIATSIRRPVTVFIFSVAAVVFGLVAVRRLATDLLPDITYPSLTVRTLYEGAAPIEVESLITRPVENVVGVTNGVVRVTSSSRADRSEVTLEFAWGTNMDNAGLDVRERLDGLQLPVDAERPVLLRFDPSLDPILRIGVHGATTGTGSDDLIRLRRLAEQELQRALERIEGVAAVVVSGGLEEEIEVEIDELKLVNLGIDADRLRARLQAENVNLTGGRLLEGQTEYLVRTVNELRRPEDLESIVIDSRNGAIVRLAEVARIRHSHRERDIITRIDGEESVEVAVYKEGGTNTVTVSDAVQASLVVLRKRLEEIDSKLKLTLITDQARFIRGSLSEVKQTAAAGGALAIWILYAFLRSWKATAIISVAIPLSIVTTFFLMYVCDISLNIMSLGGLTLGIGLLVDNAIVVLESIERHRTDGLDPRTAAERGTHEVGRAVAASTLTNICVFLPIVFVEGVAGQLFGDQALTVTFSLLVSLLVALTVIPMLASLQLAKESVEPDSSPSEERWALSRRLERGVFTLISGVARVIRLIVVAIAHALRLIMAGPLWLFQRGYDLVVATYALTLAWVLRHPYLPLLAALSLFFASLTLFPKLGRELVPELVQGELFVDLEFPPGTHLDVTQRRLARIEAAAIAIPEIATVYAIAGSSNVQGGVAGEVRENTGQINVRLTPPVDRIREEAVIDRLRDALEADGALQYRFGRPSYFSFRTPIEIEIRGYNLKLLERLADRVTKQMQRVAGLDDVKASTEGGSPELRIEFDRVRLARLGLSLGDVANTVKTKVQGTVATDIQREDYTVDIRVRAEERFRDSVNDLGALTIHTAGKTAIPLSAVATITRVTGPAEIRRSERSRVAVISANLKGRDLASVSDDIKQILEAMTFPEGFNWRITGQHQEMATSFGSMRRWH